MDSRGVFVFAFSFSSSEEGTFRIVLLPQCDSLQEVSFPCMMRLHYSSALIAILSVEGGNGIVNVMSGVAKISSTALICFRILLLLEVLRYRHFTYSPLYAIPLF